MTNKRRIWTANDKRLLKAHFADPAVSVHDIAVMLNRSTMAVTNKAYKLGLSRREHDKPVADKLQINGDAHLQQDLFELQDHGDYVVRVPKTDAPKFTHTHKLVDDLAESNTTNTDNTIQRAPYGDDIVVRSALGHVVLGACFGVVITLITQMAMGVL